MKPKNEKPDPRSSRGDKTMEQMLAAGLEAFAKFGPEGVTTRHLAKVAGVNSAAIQYYFGGKEGYYIAVVKHLIREKGSLLVSVIDKIEQHLKESVPDQKQACLLLSHLLQQMVTLILSLPEARFFASISTREHLNSTPAYEIIYETVSKLHGTVARLVGCALGIPAESPDAIIRAHAIIGQAMIFRIGATTLCRRLGIEEIGSEQVKQIASIVADIACRSLGVVPSNESMGGSQK